GPLVRRRIGNRRDLAVAQHDEGRIGTRGRAGAGEAALAQSGVAGQRLPGGRIVRIDVFAGVQVGDQHHGSIHVRSRLARGQIWERQVRQTVDRRTLTLLDDREVHLLLNLAVVVEIRVAGVAEAVLIPVLLRIVGDAQAVVAGVADAVAV